MRSIPNYESQIITYGGPDSVEYVGVFPIIESFDPDFGEPMRRYLEELDAGSEGNAIANYDAHADADCECQCGGNGYGDHIPPCSKF